MTVHAVLNTGRTVTVAPEHGETVDDIVAGLTADSLTGSGAPLATAILRTTDGEEFSYADVNTFAEAVDAGEDG